LSVFKNFKNQFNHEACFTFTWGPWGREGNFNTCKFLALLIHTEQTVAEHLLSETYFSIG
jgi:hypothetical protein